MSTTYATINTPTNGVGGALALSTIGPATFFLVGASRASAVYALEVSTDAVTFKPITVLLPGQPFTLDDVPFVSCRVRVRDGEDGASVVVGYAAAGGNESVSSVTLPLGLGGAPGAGQSMPSDQTAAKALVVDGRFDGLLILEGQSSNGVFAPIMELDFKALGEFSVSVFPFRGIFQQLRAKLTGTGSPTLKIGTTVVSAAAAVEMQGRAAAAYADLGLQPYRIPSIGIRTGNDNNTSVMPKSVLPPAGTYSELRWNLRTPPDSDGPFTDILLEVYKNGVVQESLSIPGPIVTPGSPFESGILTLDPPLTFNGTSDLLLVMFSGDMPGDGSLVFDLRSYVVLT